LWADKDNTEEPVAFMFTFVLNMEAAGSSEMLPTTLKNN
jgi:hypothetical protein